jgi:hypothetical protein
VIENQMTTARTNARNRVMRASFAIILGGCYWGCSGAGASTGNPRPSNDGQQGGANGEGEGGGISSGGPNSADGASLGSGAQQSSSDAGHGQDSSRSPDGAMTSDAISPDASSGGSPGGVAAVDAFCAQACSRAQACAAMIDGGSLNVATCNANCKANNEATALVLYRSDYVADLTACVAAANCADTLADRAAAGCQTTLASSFAPSADVVSLCHRLETSTCTQDATNSCLTRLQVYGTPTIQAIAACIADPTCTNHPACVQKALTP